MPRFVILEHDHPTRHWDFMLEEDGRLATWRIPCPPENAGLTLEAERVGDHRLDYLDYEGPVSGGRGSVSRWDRGVYDTLERTTDCWLVQLRGARWRGIVDMRLTVTRWWFRLEPEKDQADGPLLDGEAGCGMS